MINKISLWYGKFFLGHKRSALLKKNIITSLLLKGGSVFISLLLVKMTISYVSPVKYGIWLTISSLVGWFNFFDIGLGNGLRNKVAESNALNDFAQTKKYVSTTYAILAIISASVFGLFFLLSQFLNWSIILNAPQSMSVELRRLSVLLVGIFCLQFVLQTLSNVLTACHAIGKISFVNFIGQFITILAIYFLTSYTSGSLFYLCFAIAGIPLLVMALANVYFFSRDFKNIAPSFKFIDFKHTKSLFKLGGMFFIIQLGGLVLFQTDSIIVTQLWGPADVTVFNLAYKLFSVVNMVFTIVMNPFWSAFTEAYTNKDDVWIKQIMAKMYRSFLLVACLTALILVLSPYLYVLWVKDTVKVPISLSIAMFFYVLGFCWLAIQCSFLNGIGKIRLQLYLYLICMVVNVPLAIGLSKIAGIAGVTYANVIIFIVMSGILYIQTNKILKHKATGVWNK